MIFPKKVDFYYSSEANLEQIKKPPFISKDFNKIEFKKDKSQTNFPKVIKLLFLAIPKLKIISKKSLMV